jgi:hypothetical protein
MASGLISPGVLLCARTGDIQKAEQCNDKIFCPKETLPLYINGIHKPFPPLLNSCLKIDMSLFDFLSHALK